VLRSIGCMAALGMRPVSRQAIAGELAEMVAGAALDRLHGRRRCARSAAWSPALRSIGCMVALGMRPVSRHDPRDRSRCPSCQRGFLAGWIVLDPIHCLAA
jgi:hypothetical protein